MKNKTLPVQYDFSKWRTEIVARRKDPGFQEAFGEIQGAYEEISQFKHEDAVESGEDSELAELNLMLDLLTASVKCYDFEWVRKTFDPVSISPFSLALAEALYPQKEWSIIEEGFEYSVVTDANRTMVFDFFNFDQLSGSASLVLAEDPEFDAPESAIEEANLYRSQSLDKTSLILEKMQADLAAFPEPTRLSLVKNETESH